MTVATLDPADLPVDLLAEWRRDAEILDQWDARDGAKILRRCADDLETWLNERDAMPVSIAEASRLSGIPAPTLRKMIKRGELDEVGTEGPKMVRIGDLPMAPRKLRERHPVAEAALEAQRGGRGA